ncbi:hypothetical protein BJD99_10755 [Rhodococcus sp. 1163]|uniref:ABC transporter permease n=1 Tax=unclassified Rhodococcus (in: high G+C Gram-positive bacteria) TaxID=192944 RepID=UPI0009FE5AE4|nr:ABC transporter permease [Rhodococcus sp. 1163]ORI16954.1 hypothetical protein BJD99_10755 [Rhodococcus sp. 1163]
MIWSAWRLNRAPLLVSLTFIVILIVAALTAGIYIPNYPNWTWSFGGICSRWNDVGPCRPETALTLSTLFAVLLPLLFGMFVGVPTFAREVDSQMHVLSLTQSTSRVQWYFARIVVVFLPISGAMLCLGLALHWAAGPSRDSMSTSGKPSVKFSLFDFPHFETAGVVLGAYTLVVLLIGSTLALVFRSGIMAMLATLFVFLFVPVAFTWIAREHYGTPTVRSEAIDGLYRESEYPPNPYYTTDGTWVIDAGYVDASGATVRPETTRCRPQYQDGSGEKRADESDEQRAERARLDRTNRADRFDACLKDQGVDGFDIRYYTEDDFWRFQAIETGLMLTFSVAIGAIGLLQVRRLS